MEYLRSKNPFVRLMVIGKINQSVKEILKKDKFSEIDEKVIKGIFSKALNQRIVKKRLKDTFRPSWYFKDNL